ncbi:hypothetical protein [Nocardia sp. NPDC052566]|uniref:hypothetical protein n=1 Tax=Nocardia sp. NPDC052566 TaxID=3364330 RepID=UPI0037CBCB9E
MTISWPDEIDAVLVNDLTCGLSYLTPAGGAVVCAVAPIGMRDRELGTVGFTTSLGFGRKLERIERDPKVALAFHAREHGIGDTSNQRYVLVQGDARFDARPNPQMMERLGAQAAAYTGPPRRGPFWDRWLSAYYADRVLVTIEVTRIISWPSLDAAGTPEVFGAPLPDERARPQKAPTNGTAPRVDVAKAATKAATLPHRLLAYRQSDGYPAVVPVQVAASGPDGVRLTGASGLPEGGRRAGLLAHSFRAQAIGLECSQYTGWLEVDGGGAVYAPHTASGFKIPPNKTIMLLANGLLARRGLAKARKEGRAGVSGESR